MVALKLIGISIVLLGLGVAGIAIKIWAKKDGEFAGTCASQSPSLIRMMKHVRYVEKTQTPAKKTLRKH